MELIDICYPDSPANNLRFVFERALQKREFVSGQWFAFTNEEHNILILSTKVSSNTDVIILEMELEKLKKYFTFKSDILITSKSKEREKRQGWSITISILDIEDIKYVRPVMRTLDDIKEEKKVAQNNNAINRDELISICEDAIVPWQNWQNRDSGSSQYLVTDIYSLLKAGCDYEVTIENGETIWITFIDVTYDIVRDAIDNYNLYCDDIDEYKEANPEDEMFYGYGLSLGEISVKNINDGNYHLSGYLPTRKRLKESDGEDWY